MLYSIKLNVSNGNANKLKIIYAFSYLYIHKNMTIKMKATKQLSCPYIDNTRDFFTSDTDMQMRGPQQR